LYFDQSGLKNLAPDIDVLATAEGLTAHRESVAVRLATKNSPSS
jgi:histidinol dehydrogenase